MVQLWRITEKNKAKCVVIVNTFSHGCKKNRYQRTSSSWSVLSSSSADSALNSLYHKCVSVFICACPSFTSCQQSSLSIWQNWAMLQISTQYGHFIIFSITIFVWLTDRFLSELIITTCCVKRRVKNGIRYLASILTKPFRWGLTKLTSYSSSVISERCSESTVSPYTAQQSPAYYSSSDVNDSSSSTHSFTTTDESTVQCLVENCSVLWQLPRLLSL